MATATASKMKVRPLGDRVLVERIEQDEMKKGSLYIPDTAKEKPQEGKVISVGPGKTDEDGKRRALDVKSGDRILFGKYSGTEVRIDDIEYIIMREDDIFAVLG